MSQKLPAHTISHLLEKAFSEPIAIDNDIYADELIILLTQKIQPLLDHNLPVLLNILYKIDVPEARVKTILSTAKPTTIASSLAEAIVERMQQKIYFRKKYQ